MASMKAKKGNVFERLVAYNLTLAGFKVERIDDNTAGVDLVATNNKYEHYIECKHHKGFTWNQLVKIYNKTVDYSAKHNKTRGVPWLIFKGNNQPVLIMYREDGRILVSTFDSHFMWTIVPIPKGYKVWRDND